MRTFHTGGVAGGDITQGLPRVEELFEARKPKKMAQLAEISGRVTLEESKRITICNVTITADDGESRRLIHKQKPPLRHSMPDAKEE